MTFSSRVAFNVIPLVLLVWAITGIASQEVPLGAKWIPTDLNYGVLSQLRGSPLQTLPDQIAGDCLGL